MLVLAPSPAAQGLRVETVNDLPSFLDLEEPWNLLVQEAGIPYPFLRHEWVRIWWECFGGGRELRIVLVRDGPDLIGLAPLMLGQGSMYGIRARRLEFLADIHTRVSDFVVGRRPREAHRAIWAHLARQPDWDLLLLRDLPEESGVLAQLPGLARADGFPVGRWPSHQCPYVPLAGGWDAYFQGLRPKHRSNLRNRFKRLGRIGAVERELVSTADQGALDDALRIEALGWKGTKGTAIRNQPELERFYRRLTEEASDQGWLRLHFLRVGGRRIAFQYHLEYGDRVYVLKLGYDPEFAPCSPQNLLCSLVLEDAFARGLGSYEFLGSREPWKLEWAREARPLDWLFVFRNHPRGQLLHGVKFRVIPWLRQAPLYAGLRDLVFRRRRGPPPSLRTGA